MLRSTRPGASHNNLLCGQKTQGGTAFQHGGEIMQVQIDGYDELRASSKKGLGVFSNPMGKTCSGKP